MTKPVKFLPDQVIDQIAAGEIIERPASVVKELVENSIDAQASQITVEIHGGGKKSIRITDNGSGMTRENLSSCIGRFATSKISSASDLEEIDTYGFRGEAIPSIASVSQMTITSADPEGKGASLIQIEGGKTGEIKDAVLEKGTRVVVENLFFNLPARLKFLKTDPTETKKIEAWLEAIAMAHPEISFRLIADGETVFETSQRKNFRERLLELFGKEWLDSCAELDYAFLNGRMDGFLTLPSRTRRDRTEIKIFVNGRLVQSQILNYIISKFYRDKIPHGTYPSVILFVKVKPSLVDVNVHPAKLEIRFRNENEIISSGLHAFASAFTRKIASSFQNPEPQNQAREMGENPLSQVKVPVSFQDFQKNWYGTTTVSSAAPAMDYSSFPVSELSHPVLSESLENKAVSGKKWRLVGQVKDRYLVVEMEDGFALMDQHASHERVLYEKTLKQREKSQVESQKLLMPEVISLSNEDYSLLESNRESLNKLGFSMEPFGRNTFSIDALPPGLSEKALSTYLQALAAYLRDPCFGSPGLEKLIRGVCRQSVMFGDRLSPEEQEKLMEDLWRCDNPFSCPHGRPVMYKISWSEIDRKLLRNSG